MTGTWLKSGDATQDAPLRLFCFAHAGGGSGFYRPWREKLLPEIEVCPVILPGRETRVAEPAHRSMEDLIGPLCTGLAPHLDRPYALFGHSTGAAIAYEVARRFQDDPARAPAGCWCPDGAPRIWRPAVPRSRDSPTTTSCGSSPSWAAPPRR